MRTLERVVRPLRVALGKINLLPNASGTLYAIGIGRMSRRPRRARRGSVHPRNPGAGGTRLRRRSGACRLAAALMPQA